ncbi:MAG TPA: 4-hydroxy-tetrahydrodipicolinate synthase [Acidimicrobiales bacterium]|nr:4-hydroxy-tetrahydrodipicolinate synthase [Acidimicrobiales bacterium]
MTPRLGSLLTAMVTPFESDGSLDLEGAARLAQFLVEQGSDGLVVAGSTGEGSSLSDEERLELFAAVAASVTVPVIAGTSSADTARSVDLTKVVASTGVSGVLATTPAYARPSQAGLAGHLGAVADATHLPVMLYDIPSRTGRKIAAATTVALVEAHPNIVALKDASGDLPGAAHVKATLGDRLDLYSGDDSVTLPFLAVGGVGLVSVAAHWAGPEFSLMIQSALKGDWDGARALNERLAASYAFESTDVYPNPMPARAALRALGVEVGECRAPHARGDATLHEAAKSVVDALLASRG